MIMRILFKTALFSGFVGILLSLVYLGGQFIFAQNLPIREKQTEMSKNEEIISKLSDDNLKLNHQDEFVEIFEKIGGLKIKQAIPQLLNLIDYRVEDKWENSPVGFRLISKSSKYPALGALIQIGDSSVPGLIEIIENEKADSIKSENALYAIQQIHLADLFKCILLLEEASTKSKFPNGSERLQIAASKTKQLLEKRHN